MVLGKLFKLLKYVLSSLHKNAALHHKEETYSHTEQKGALNEEIHARRGAKYAKELKIDDDKLRIAETRTKRESEEFGVLIQQSIDTQNPELLTNASATLKLILKDFETVVGLWKQSYHNLKRVLKEIREAKKVSSKMRKSLRQENKTMTQDVRLLKKSARQGQLLDQDKKSAILSRRQNLNSEIITGVDEAEKLADRILNTFGKEPQKIRQLLIEAKKIKTNLKQKFKNWPAVLDIIRQIQLFIKKTGSYLQELDVFVQMTEKESVQIEALNKIQFQRFAEKKKLDAMYDKLLIDEEIAVQKGAESKPKAA